MQNVIDSFRLPNKVALITGAASGLGAAIATALAAPVIRATLLGRRKLSITFCMANPLYQPDKDSAPIAILMS